MKKIEHQIFLKQNALNKKLLLQPIREKIEIFDRMYLLLKSVSDCEKGYLLEQLEALDLEILEDIDEEYADKLEYNNIEDILEDKPKLETIIVNKPKGNQKPLTTEESILDELVKMKRTKNIGRSTFKDLGIKQPLAWKTIIGKYLIKRTSVFKYKYNIERVE